jgi:hypothetical protein
MSEPKKQAAATECSSRCSVASIGKVKRILHKKGWSWRKRKATTGSVYLWCECGYRRVLVRISDHGWGRHKMRSGGRKPDVSLHPGGDSIARLIQVLDGVD